MKGTHLKISWLALMASLLVFPLVLAQEQIEAIPGASDYDQLEQGESRFSETWIDPQADFTQYHKIYIWNAVFEFRDVGPALSSRSTMVKTSKSEFGISDTDREKFEQVVRDAFLEEMDKGKRFKLVDSVGPDTLLLRASVLDIVSNVPPEARGRSQVYLSQVGQGTFVMELIDSETGEVLALLSEQRVIGKAVGVVSATPASTSTIIADIHQWAAGAAQQMRKELDKALAGK